MTPPATAAAATATTTTLATARLPVASGLGPGTLGLGRGRALGGTFRTALLALDRTLRPLLAAPGRTLRTTLLALGGTLRPLLAAPGRTLRTALVAPGGTLRPLLAALALVAPVTRPIAPLPLATPRLARPRAACSALAIATATPRPTAAPVVGVGQRGAAGTPHHPHLVGPRPETEEAARTLFEDGDHHFGTGETQCFQALRHRRIQCLAFENVALVGHRSPQSCASRPGGKTNPGMPALALQANLRMVGRTPTHRPLAGGCSLSQPRRSARQVPVKGPQDARAAEVESDRVTVAGTRCQRGGSGPTAFGCFQTSPVRPP